jgi:hypothetical protein
MSWTVRVSLQEVTELLVQEIKTLKTVALKAYERV